MADVILRLEIDPSTGKKNITIDYGSDEDALPMEHEEDHRRIVDRLIEGGTLRAAELGTIRVHRDGELIIEDLAAESIGESSAVPVQK